MADSRFPHPETSDPDGLVAIGGDLRPETLVDAYSHGIFPWPIEGAPVLTWFSPHERGVLEFDRLIIPKSLRKFSNQNKYFFTINQVFSQVIEACSATPRPGQNGTWITPDMIQAYCHLHSLGIAHSVETWERDSNKLVGGLYGLFVEGVFSGESMFHSQPNASKLALLHLIQHLKQRNCKWIDIQMLTPHMEKLGARNLPRKLYLELLREAQAEHAQSPKPF